MAETHNVPLNTSRHQLHAAAKGVRATSSLRSAAIARATRITPAASSRATSDKHPAAGTCAADARGAASATDLVEPASRVSFSTPSTPNARATRVTSKDALTHLASTSDSDCGQNPVFDAMFHSQITDMGLTQAEDESGRGCGKYWKINPAEGAGGYWYLAIDDLMAVAVFDLTFNRDVHFSASAPNFFCFGCYGQNMIPYFTPLINVEEGWNRGTLLGYIWQKAAYESTALGGQPLRATSISLMPQAATLIADELDVSPLSVTTAISHLDGNQQIPELQNLFAEMRTSRPSPSVARGYYRCKIVEACALLVSWWERNVRDGSPRVRAIDRTAFNLACAYAREHLHEGVTLDDLCRAACMSASKLTGLFKDIEGTTPMGYVREQRMERACELLRESDEPLASISESLGFTRQGSFSEAFKNRFGMTPHAYRKMKTR